MTRLKTILKQYTKNLVVLSETENSVTIDSYYNDMGPRVCIREDGTHYIKK